MKEALTNNRINKAFEKERILNIYYTAGYPSLDDTIRVAKAIEKGGANMIEIGMPYSDPIADGPTIQESSNDAIANGMTIPVLFDQLENLREHVSIPVILMGYLNPIIQYGVEKFVARCSEVGVDGVIIPDLPMHDFQEVYKGLFQKAGVANIFLITPQTSEDRIKNIDENSTGFIYMVSSASVTGAKSQVTNKQKDYFERIENMNLSSKRLIGFGISNKETFHSACLHAHGAIIGSAFIKQLKSDASEEAVISFIKNIIS